MKYYAFKATPKSIVRPRVLQSTSSKVVMVVGEFTRYSVPKMESLTKLGVPRFGQETYRSTTQIFNAAACHANEMLKPDVFGVMLGGASGLREVVPSCW